MPAAIHKRAIHLLAKNPKLDKSQAFAIATQQMYAIGKTPKNYGTSEGKASAKEKYPNKGDYVKTPNPGKLNSPKLAGAVPTKSVLIEATGDGAEAIAEIAKRIHKRGNTGHSFSITEEHAPKAGSLGGWDGDGNDRIRRITVTYPEGKKKVTYDSDVKKLSSAQGLVFSKFAASLRDSAAPHSKRPKNNGMVNEDRPEPTDQAYGDEQEEVKISEVSRPTASEARDEVKKVAFSKSQYSGPLSMGRFKQESQIPPYRHPPVKTAGPPSSGKEKSSAAEAVEQPPQTREEFATSAKDIGTEWEESGRRRRKAGYLGALGLGLGSFIPKPGLLRTGMRAGAVLSGLTGYSGEAGIRSGGGYRVAGDDLLGNPRSEHDVEGITYSPSAHREIMQYGKTLKSETGKEKKAYDPSPLGNVDLPGMKKMRTPARALTESKGVADFKATKPDASKALNIKLPTIGSSI